MAFKKGQSGNPAGRKKGVKTARVRFREYFEEAGEYLIPDLIRMAQAGNMDAMKICIDRIIPKAKEDSINFEIPDLMGKTPEQLVTTLFEAMSYQTMSADEVNCVLNMIKTFRSNDDAASVREVIDKSNLILDELRLKNERDY